MREIITLHIGQAGCQMAPYLWDLYYADNMINPNGEKSSRKVKEEEFLESTVFFHEFENKYVPRSLLIDYDPKIKSSLNNNQFLDLFPKDHLIIGSASSSNNFSRGHYHSDNNLVGAIKDQIRKLTEKCDSVQGFQIFHSINGGTGSGLASMLLDESNVFGKKNWNTFSIIPSETFSTTTVEPYNSTLALYFLDKFSDLSFVFDNQKLFKICNEQLYVENPNYDTINQIIARAAHSITCPYQSNSSLNPTKTMEELKKSLAINQKKYPLISFSPLSNINPENEIEKEIEKEKENEKEKEKEKGKDISDLTNSLFEMKNYLKSCSLKNEKISKMNLYYRGNISEKEMNTSLELIKSMKNLNFASDFETFKSGLITNSIPNISSDIFDPFDKCITMASNSTSLKSTFKNIATNFDTLYRKRAYVHWYVGEGLEEGQFSEAREVLEQIIHGFEN
ncbi:hypothetical protein M0813_06121 [Anaeramoeba flamelloides]|uniref:Tubulin/FtsZ GTPase domain-containing protein n=1 Tax=Anaeramoeba flamelloides TaxID=1746091 RepID=A0ABQ8XEU3_9EUKA|nr:hypothetical protein M0813_06121 [Anaeramoeba flamelloides]